MNTSPNGDAHPVSVRILDLAKDKGLDTPKAIADAAAIPDTTFYRNIRQPGKFKFEHLEAIAAVLGVAVSELIAEAA